MCSLTVKRVTSQPSFKFAAFPTYLIWCFNSPAVRLTIMEPILAITSYNASALKICATSSLVRLENKKIFYSALKKTF
jgi:hypothetical protein